MNEDKKSRTIKTLMNAGASLTNQAILLITKFISRYVFIFTLGQEYLGVSALFSSVITMLSLADLGFSIALPQALYEPLAKKDEDRICKIMKFYSKVYTVIALIVLVVGVALLPFLQFIIGNKEMNSIEHIDIIYLLFILQSSVSYVFIYKRTLFIADQKNYYVIIIESITTVVSTLIQIVVLLLLKNYILYLCISIITIMIQNIVISKKCDKNYPFLRDVKAASGLDKLEVKMLSKKIYSLFIYKAAIAVESGTDNLIMTSFCGLVLTGLCSNYTLVTTSITGVLMTVMSSATASIGNVIVTENGEDTFRIYSLLDFIGFWVYSVFGICLVILINPFISIWLGKDYLIDFATTVFLCINFYICGVQNVNSNFRNAYGLFYEGRYRPICMILINIGFSILLAKKIGVVGIFVGTLLSRILTVGTFDPYIVFRYGLHLPLKKYYQSHLWYHVITLLTGTGMYLLFSNWHTYGILSLGLKSISLFLMVNAIYACIFFRNSNYKNMLQRIREMIRKAVYGR